MAQRVLESGSSSYDNEPLHSTGMKNFFIRWQNVSFPERAACHETFSVWQCCDAKTLHIDYISKCIYTHYSNEDYTLQNTFIC